MAACLITISGTSGKVQIDYDIGVDHFVIQANEGTLYIEDTATDVTYTTITGDLIASSGCLTVTELPFVYYNLKWKGIIADGYLIDNIILDCDNALTIPDSPFPDPRTEFVESVNSLNDDGYKIVAYKRVNNGTVLENNYMLRTINSENAMIRARNSDDTAHVHIVGELLLNGNIPVDYTEVNICD